MTKRKRSCPDDIRPDILPPEQSLGGDARDARSHAAAGHEEASAMVDVLPGITRKITACTACRKQKIKCDMTHGPPCNLHATLNAVCQHINLPLPKPLVSLDTNVDHAEYAASDHERDHLNLSGCEISPPATPSAVHAPIDTFLDIAKLGSPGSSSHSLQSARTKQTIADDFVSRRVLTVTVAESLVNQYLTRLDPYLYGICSEYRSLQQLQTKSPPLLAAICTVAALHDPQGQSLYDACNREFRRLVSRSLFEKHDPEYVRALCISSFWLSDASRILSSDAVRRAADMRLHRSFENVSTASNGSLPGHSPAIMVQRDRVRLWYLIFISDHHLSVLHNRDPLLRSDKDIAMHWETFLNHDQATDSDVRLVSQVALLLIMGQIRDLLGSEQEAQVPQALANQIMHYSRQLDKWFTKFSVLFKPDPHIGEFPRRGLQLHYQFGKLYLGHQVFKGLDGQPIPASFVVAACMAHDAAVAIFEMLLQEEQQLQQNLVGMPHYFHIMIAFAGHFLLEVTKTYALQLSILPDRIFSLIRRVLALFQTTPGLAQHPISRMTPGLHRKLSDCIASLYPLQNSSQDPSVSLDYDPRVVGMPQQPFSFQAESLVTAVDDFLLTDFGEGSFSEMMPTRV
ncbi:hypothetical protein P170DRAFT_475933 [Aspergillus steynii IBT 23096]|uniref:Zn(2)-C6 fungal-type domain-containing protein n=1 Tax=Aspergillus steynii IBT 23096 TaxID=1392250 RepID=A0A2I2G9T3_9EURO|nr:uncharacterized protein P170DRAFT_475933 [Aspergillus steynii IBT 23096]PLB49639.1 hypothetical protein P170DRAFT_475933 [Aspergillus steynii IBT 23096]